MLFSFHKFSLGPYGPYEIKTGSDVGGRRDRSIEITIRHRADLLLVAIAVDIVGLGWLTRTIQEISDHATLAFHLNGTTTGERISFGD